VPNATYISQASLWGMASALPRMGLRPRTFVKTLVCPWGMASALPPSFRSALAPRRRRASALRVGVSTVPPSFRSASPPQTSAKSCGNADWSSPRDAARKAGGRAEAMPHIRSRKCKWHWARVPAPRLYLIAILLAGGCSRVPDENALERHRNLGKAFYENPTTKEDAVREFQQAFKIAPDSARDKLNYALALLRVEGREPEAVKLLEEVKRQDPSLPHTWFNLGIYYKRQGDANRAIAQFEGMIARAPEEPIGHYQLGTLYQQQKRNAAAQAQFEPRLASTRSWRRRGFSCTTCIGWPEMPRRRTGTSPSFRIFRSCRKPG